MFRWMKLDITINNKKQLTYMFIIDMISNVEYETNQVEAPASHL